jgi:hypothetical protein
MSHSGLRRGGHTTSPPNQINDDAPASSPTRPRWSLLRSFLDKGRLLFRLTALSTTATMPHMDFRIPERVVNPVCTRQLISFIPAYAFAIEYFLFAELMLSAQAQQALGFFHALLVMEARFPERHHWYQGLWRELSYLFLVCCFVLLFV